MPTITRVLVANRGEIALRIIRACHEERFEAVAVYSEADRLSPHVRAAELAVAIGPAPATQSYLNGDKLIEAAQATGCQAIHPGYGMDGLAAGRLRRLDELVAVQIGLGRRRGTDRHGELRRTHVRRQAVGLGVDGHRL